MQNIFTLVAGCPYTDNEPLSQIETLVDEKAKYIVSA
jgi:hypothetical protein